MYIVRVGTISISRKFIIFKYLGGFLLGVEGKHFLQSSQLEPFFTLINAIPRTEVYDHRRCLYVFYVYRMITLTYTALIFIVNIL